MAHINGRMEPRTPLGFMKLLLGQVELITYIPRSDL